MTVEASVAPRILELAAGPARLRLAPELGGRITALRLAVPGTGGTRDIFTPFPEETAPDALFHWPKGGLYPLVPYSNRIRDGRLRFGGRDYPVPPHPDAAPHSLHGHAHRVPWRLADRGADAARWVLDHPGGGEWHWRFRAEMTARLSPHALDLGLALANAGDQPMPAGLGVHPYLIESPNDELRFGATTDWPVTPDFLAGEPVSLPNPGPRAPMQGPVTLYRGGWDGTCEVAFASGGRLRLTADTVFGHLVVHRPEGAPYVCLEPVTHVADGFNLTERGRPDAGRTVLAPGETLAGRIRLALLPDGNDSTARSPAP